MVKEQNMWKLVGSWYVPDPSPVCDRQRWFGFGKLLALALLTEGSISPVSPILIYQLLLRLPLLNDPSAMLPDPLHVMHLSLKFIKEVDQLQAEVLLPWMIIAPGQDWRQLPDNHRTQLLYMITGLEIDVSG